MQRYTVLAGGCEHVRARTGTLVAARSRPRPKKVANVRDPSTAHLHRNSIAESLPMARSGESAHSTAGREQETQGRASYNKRK
eukprot:12508987-Alexandrium_andersonii.AAC.1